jgi:hypothetical protein
MGFIFAFGSSRVNTIVKNIREFPESISMELAPHTIYLLDEKALISLGPSIRRGVKKDGYEARQLVDDGLLLTHLFSFFVACTLGQTQWAHEWWQVPSNLWDRIRDESKLVDSRIQIGQSQAGP